MPRVRPIKTNFTNGEVDPLITMRSDLELFVNGASLMRNVLPFPQGGFRRRDGLETMTKIPPSGTLPIGLADITVSAGGTNYVIGDLVSVSGGTSNGTAQARVTAVSGSGIIAALEMVSIGNYSVVPSSPAATSGATGSGATVTWTEETQDVIKLIDFSFSISQNYIIAFTIGRWYVFRKEDTGSGPNQLVDANVNGVYDNQQLNEITWTQSLDEMIVFHNELPMRKVVRVGETNWTFAEFFPANPPTDAFGDIQTADLTVAYDNAAVGDTKTVTASAASFVAANVGDYIRVSAVSDALGNNFQSYLEITAFTSSTVVTGKFLVLPILADQSTATYRVGGPDWLLEQVAFSKEHGYPRCGVFYQGRLITAGTTDRPQTMFTSRAGDINDFNSGGAEDDLGIVARLDSGERTTVLNINGGRHLQFFTDNAEYYVPISEGAAITPSNIAFRLTSSVGSDPGIPVFNVDGVVYFTQRGGASFRSFEFVDGEKAYDSLIVSLFSSHLIRNPIDAAFKKSLNTEKGNYIWVVNQDDFSLTVFSVLKSELINAWALQTTQGKFKGVAVSDQDSYFHVTRNPGGSIDYSGLFREFSVSQGSSSAPRGAALSNDGAKMFVVSDTTNTVYEYALNFANSLQRVVYTGNSFDVSGETTAPRAIDISPDGLKMFVMDASNEQILEYDLAEPNSLADGNVTDSGFTLDYFSTAPFGVGFDFSPDGKNIIICDVTDAKVFLFTANTGFTFEDGTVDTEKEFDVSDESGSPVDAKWSADGLRFFMLGLDAVIYQYNMTTASDVSTASYSEISFFTGDQGGIPVDMTFSVDGLTLMVVEVGSDSIYEYDLSNSFQFGERTDWIEFFQSDLKFDAAVAQFSGITTPVTAITGQAQLANETVGIIIDGVLYEDQVVSSSGGLTFPIEAHYNYQIGLHFPNIIIKDENDEDLDTGFNVLVRSLPADILLPEGSAMGQKKRVPSVNVRYDNTQGFYLQEHLVPFRNLPNVLDRPIPRQTGQEALDGLLGWDEFGYVTIGQKEPMDMTILGWAYDLSTGA